MGGVRALPLVVAICGSVCVAAAPTRGDVTVASGKLAHHHLSNDLFRIDKLWIQVAPDTQFHRWLSEGIGGKAAIVLTNGPDRFGDRPNVRILSGRLMHGTAPNTSPIVHTMFLVDALTGSVGAVTLQTYDRVTAQRFDAFDDTDISIVIEIK